MWIPKYLKLENFISHKQTTFSFKQGEVVVLSGKNEDDSSQESNGSGKSGIVEGMAFVLTGSYFRSIKTVDELILNNSSYSKVSTEFYNTKTKKTLFIERVIFVAKSKSSQLLVKVNNEIPSYINQTAGKVDTNDGNKAILYELDISKKDLFNYFIISKKKHINFFDMTDREMKEVIGRFSNSNMIDGLDKSVEIDLLTQENALREIELDRSRLDGKEEMLNQRLDEVDKEQLDSSIIDEYKRQLKQTSILYKESQNKLSQFLIAYNKAKSKYNSHSFDNTDYDKKISKVNASIEAQQKQIDKYKSLIASLKGNYNKLTTFLKNTIKCPNCSHEFNSTHLKVSVSEMAIKKQQTSESINRNQQTVQELTQQQNESYEERIAVLQNKKQNQKIEIQLQKQVDLTLKDKQREENTFNSLEKAINELEDKINNFDISYWEELRESKKAKIREKKQQILRNRRKLNQQEVDIGAKLERFKQWRMRFKQFQTHLANKSIGAIESYTNRYLKEIRSHLTILIDGITITKAGKIREKINVQVCKNGELIGSYGKLSEGESVRVNVCNILAKQKLINMNSSSGGLDLLLLDEIVESVDSEGIYQISEALNGLNQTIVMITHATNNRPVPNQVWVIKSQGISKIK